MVLRLGIDGVEDVTRWSRDECCPTICLDLCGLMCAYIALLPNGPLWDYHKMTAMEKLQSDNGMDPCAGACLPEVDSCRSLVHYAMYLGQTLHSLIHNVLWPTLREASPDTAVTTLDSWLERLAWEDCYKTLCRKPMYNALSQFEIPGVDGCPPIYCDFDLNQDLDCAVKRGIVRTLARINRGFIKNQDGFNFVLEPLGVKLDSVHQEPCPTDYEIPVQCCPPTIRLSNIDGTIEACPTRTMQCDSSEPTRISAAFNTGCDVPAGLPAQIYPNLAAAECIVRSLLHKSCPNILVVDYC